MNAQNNEDQMVNLNEFADLAGFPVELIQKELFANGESTDKISLAELREVMIKYLDSTMLN